MNRFYLGRLAIVILIWGTVCWTISAITPEQHARHTKNLERDKVTEIRLKELDAKYERMRQESHN